LDGVMAVSRTERGLKEDMTREVMVGVANPARKTKMGLWRSHVRNFADQSGDPDTLYLSGPDKTLASPEAMEAIIRKAQAYVQAKWREDPSKPIDIIGHSRGGYIAMELARRLNTEGLMDEKGTIHKSIPVRFMGLYDPVDMAPGWGESEKIASNVRTAAVVFAKWPFNYQPTPDRATRQESGGPGAGSRSRSLFNRADHGPENRLLTEYLEKWVWGTHAGIGGDPWGGDQPPGHSQANDNRIAVEVDQWMRKMANKAGLSVGGVGNYGY
jgi:pimeloyl-ACP methyl ester carboxylesterase